MRPIIIKSKTKGRIPLIANIPHSSTYIPLAIRKTLVLNDLLLDKQILKLTDLYTDEIFSSIQQLGGTLFIYNANRLVLDPERFENDNQEKMSRKGMGVIYTKTVEGEPLRNIPTPSEREALLKKYYRPYHKALERATTENLKKFGRCLIIDCHSFPSIPLKYEDDKDLNRPNICIGKTDFHTPPAVIRCIESYCEGIDWSTSINRPFSGTYVPMKYYKKESNVMSVMIEVNRSLYMNERSGKKNALFTQTKKRIKILLQHIIDDLKLNTK